MIKYEVKQDILIADYLAIEKEKQAVIEREFETVNALNPTRYNIEGIKADVVNAVNAEYADKEAFFQKYITSVDVPDVDTVAVDVAPEVMA